MQKSINNNGNNADTKQRDEQEDRLTDVYPSEEHDKGIQVEVTEEVIDDGKDQDGKITLATQECYDDSNT